VEENGYQRNELWSAEGWGWREREKAEHPGNWRRDPETRLDSVGTSIALGSFRTSIGRSQTVCWYEAEAYCHGLESACRREDEWRSLLVGIGPAFVL